MQIVSDDQNMFAIDLKIARFIMLEKSLYFFIIILLFIHFKMLIN